MTPGTSTLPHVLSGTLKHIDDPVAGRVSYYVDGPAPGTEPNSNDPPLLLVHSINASASAHEAKPIFDAYKKHRQVFALDLPGFGHSERSDRTYDQSLMVAAIHALIKEIASEQDKHRIDALAVSLSCEFIAQAALEYPDFFRTLALVSPTGFAKIAETKGPPEANCGRPGVLRFLQTPYIGQGLFKLLSSAPVIRFFLKKTWGRKEIDEEFFETSCRMVEVSGAQHAPFHFISGYLFSADILTTFKALDHPVWLSHGVRGDFNDFSKTDSIAEMPNWRITEFQTGALPYFEVTEDFLSKHKEFLESAESTKVDAAD